MPRTWTIYVVRHAIAEERGPDWPDDSKRPLTERGAKEFRQTARALRTLDVSIDVILTSPFVRARQTAELLAEALRPLPAIEKVDSLVPGAAHAMLVADLTKHARRETIALVGHEPAIGATAARLAGLRHRLEFKKSAICRIDLEELPPGRAGTLRWFAPPKLLRRVR